MVEISKEEFYEPDEPIGDYQKGANDAYWKNERKKRAMSKLKFNDILNVEDKFKAIRYKYLENR